MRVAADGQRVLVVNGRLADTPENHAFDELDELLLDCARRGISALDGLRGSYGLCLIDIPQNLIVVQRDALGGRTACVAFGEERILAASHAQALARHPACGFHEAPGYLAARLSHAGFPLAGQSPFAGIDALLPGERRCWQDGRERTEHRPIAVPSSFQDPGEQQVFQQFRERLENAICNGLRGRQCVASMLSGGLDSAPATALARKIGQQSGCKVLPVSWHLDGRPGDERGWIEAVATHLGVDAEFFDGNDCIPYARLDKEQINPDWMEYNPFRDLLEGCIGRGQAAGADTVINATAGDFIYPQFNHLLPGLLANGDWGRAMRLVGRRAGQWWRWRKMPWRDPAMRFFLRRLLSKREHRLHAPSRFRQTYLAASLRGQAPFRIPVYPDSILRHPVPEYPAFALGQAFAFNRACESWFAECRGLHYFDPYQDQALMELMLGLPFHYSYRNGQSKWLMRETSRGLIPESVRTKQRTGDLFPLLLHGYRRHRAQARERLMDCRGWQALCDVALMDRVLAEGRPSEGELVLVNQLLGYVLWREYWSDPPPLAQAN